MITFTPSSTVNLRGKAGETKRINLSISAGLDEPLILKPIKLSNELEGKVSYSLNEVEKGKLYKINFQNNPDIAGNFDGYLWLSTNYKGKPKIRVRVNTRFK